MVVTSATASPVISDSLRPPYKLTKGAQNVAPRSSRGTNGEAAKISRSWLALNGLRLSRGSSSGTATVSPSAGLRSTNSSRVAHLNSVLNRAM